MNLRSARLIFAGLSTLVLAATLFQQVRASARIKDFSVNNHDQTATFECMGDTVTIKGNDNTITVKGDCSKLTVNGDDNNIKAASVREVQVSGDDNTIEVVTVAKISAVGDDNNIIWGKGAGGKPPEISSKGEDNKIRQTGN
jgi:Protein of unknown function (DUF3060)